MAQRRQLLGLVAFAFLFAVLLRVSPVLPAQAARSPLVLAFYYAWFDENTWKPSQVPDMPAFRYNSRDPQTIARQIQQARDSGIDAFIVSWLGKGNPTEDNFKLLLDQARAVGWRAAVDFEVTSPFYRSRDDMVNALKYLLATHATQPAYLRVDGKPVVFFWREQKYSVETWRAIRDAVDPNRQSIWIAEGIDTSYLQVFDGHHLYSIGWAKDPAAELAKWPPRIQKYGADKIWVATVMPGNDDLRTRRSGAYVRDRRGGDFYRQTWNAALATHPDWIIITSWNEWIESTMIEPSVTYGNLYLDITRQYAAVFKAGQPAPPPPPTRTPGPTAVPTSTPAPLPIAGGVPAVTTDVLRVRSDPSTESPVLGRLREGATLTLLGRSNDNEWWQIAYPDTKKRGWVSADYINVPPEASALPVVQRIQASALVSVSAPLDLPLARIDQ